MSRREPMKPVEGLKKPVDLPGPTARPRTLTPVPTPAPTAEPDADGPILDGQSAPTLTSVQSAPSPAAQRESESKTEPRARKQRAEKAPAAERKASASPSAEMMKAVSVSVPFTLAEAWRDRAKNDRTSQVDVLLDAIVTHKDQLSALVAAASERPTVSDGLFDRGASAVGERFVGVSLRIKSTNLDVVDQLAEKHGPVKRSPFVAAVLSAYLDLNDKA